MDDVPITGAWTSFRESSSASLRRQNVTVISGLVHKGLHRGLIAAVLVLASCATSGGKDDFSAQLTPRAKHVRDRGNLADPARASVRELALSIPIYTGSGGDGKTSPQGDSWVLLGDASQPPVMVKVLTEPGENPVRMKLIHGSNPPDDPQVATTYELEKVPGGWKILSAKKGRSSELLVWPMD